MRIAAYLHPIEAYVDALVHPCARGDALAAARHRTFIRSRLLAGLIALAIMPVHFAVRGAPTPFEALIFGWLTFPLFAAWHLARSGNYERAHLFSLLGFAGLVVIIAGSSGGVTSFAALWLALIPVDAALSASRRLVLAAVAIGIACATGLWSLEAMGALPAPTAASADMYLIAALAALLYSGAAALGSAALAQTGDAVRAADHARYAVLADHADLVVKAGRSGSVVFASPAAERLLGVPAAQIHGDGLFERVHVGDRPAFATALDRVTNGTDSVTVEYRLRRQDDTEFIWVETEWRPAGREIVGVTRDVSARHAAVEARDAARAEADRIGKTRQQVFATLGHELRTPLNAIVGFAELLGREGLEPAAERRREYASLIRDGGRHLLEVVNGVLDAARLEAGRLDIAPEPIAVGPVVEGCYEMMLLRAEEAGVALDLELADAMPELVADPCALRQIVINLLANAIRFTPAGGSVALSARFKAGSFEFTVADTGIGIDAGDLPRVGDPFFQVRASDARKGAGIGLGLSIVKGLVDLHGGRFELASRPGQGTRATVRVPRDCRGTRRASPEAIKDHGSRPRAIEQERMRLSA